MTLDTRKRLLFAIAAAMIVILVWGLWIDPPKSSEPSEALERAEAELQCPSGTEVSGGDGALRSSYGCARPGAASGEYDGPYGQWYRDGTRALAGQYAGGKQTGKWVYWRPDGTVEMEVEFENGLRHGTSVARNADGSVADTFEYDRGVLVSANGAPPEMPKIPAPSDTSCAAVSRRVTELVETQMGGGVPEDERAKVERDMKRIRDGLLVGCTASYSEAQRTCLMVVPSVANARWCTGPGPQWCVDAFAHVGGLIEQQSGLSEADLAEAKQDLAFTTRACMAQALFTRAQYECVVGSQTSADIEKCRDAD